MHGLLALTLLAADPLGAARAHLAAGDPASLVLDLDDASAIPKDQAGQAAQLLIDGSKLAQKSDPVLALQLAQMAHRRDARSAAAAQQLGELALAAHDDAEAERWCNTWQDLAPGDAHPALLRARVAADEHDWDTLRALAGSLSTEATLSKAEQAQAASLLATANAHQAAPRESSEAQIKRAAELAARDRDEDFSARVAPRGADVVMYSTSWCSVCRRARDYFKTKKIAFEDYDIEKDRDALERLHHREQETGLRATGVPVIDVKGNLMEGFDPKRIEETLAQ